MSDFRVGDIVSIRARVTSVNRVTIDVTTMDVAPMGFYVPKEAATLVERPKPKRPTGSVWIGQDEAEDLDLTEPYWRIIVISEDECVVTYPRSGRSSEIRRLDSFEDMSHWVEEK